MFVGKTINFIPHFQVMHLIFPHFLRMKIENEMSLFFSDESIQQMSMKEHDIYPLSDDDEEQNIADEVADWATKFRMSLVALSALLHILHLHKLNVPKDPRTLLETPFDYEMQQTDGGSYLYFRVEKGIISAFKRFSGCFPTGKFFLNLQINVDGMPLFKSSLLQLWPILGQITELHQLGPFGIALFYGSNKPFSLQEYLVQFVEEMKLIAKKWC